MPGAAGAGATARDLPVLSTWLGVHSAPQVSMNAQERDTCLFPMTIHVNLTLPLQAASAVLESSLHDQPQGKQWLAARTPWYTCPPEGRRRRDTAPPCHSLHAPMWGRHPAANATGGPGQVTGTSSWARQEKQE